MTRFGTWLLALVLVAGLVHTARAVTAAGADRHVWLIQPLADEQGTLLAHYGPNDPPDTLGKVRTLSQAVAPRAAATTGDRLYVIHPNGTMQTFQARRVGVEQRWAYQSQPGPSLPNGVTVRDLAVGASGPWALVRVDDAEALSRLDRQHDERPAGTPLPPLAEQELLRNIYLGLPPGMRLDTDEPTAAPQPKAKANEDEDENAGTPQPREVEGVADRLLRLQGGRWRPVALPDDWPHGSKGRMVASAEAGLRLVVQSDDADEVVLHVYQWDAEGGQWSRQTYNANVPGTQPWTAALVESHLVIAWQVAEAPPLRVEATLLRHGRVRPVGVLTLPDEAIAWDVASREDSLWLIAQHASAYDSDTVHETAPVWRWVGIDLHGNTGPVSDSLQWREPMGIGQAADYFIMVGVLVSAVLLMLLFWRRDAQANQLALPETLVLGGLGRRFLAAMMDLLPPVVLIMAVYDLTPAELLMRWPGGGGSAVSWQAIEPGVLVVLLFVAYTTVAELLLRRTIGKAIFGLHVSDLTGERPRAWQLLARNLLKSFDLVAWPLLILVVLGPYRQRLGDLVARTVIVIRAETPTDEEKKDNGE